MADNSVKEQKLAAARKKLQQFRIKRGEERAKFSISRETSPSLEPSNIIGSETSSSRSSSVADVREISSSIADIRDVSSSVAEVCDLSKVDQTLLNGLGNQPYNPLGITLGVETAVTNVPVTNINSENLNSVPFQIPGEERNAFGSNVEVPIFDSVNQEYSKDIEKKCENLTYSDYVENEGSVCSETNASMTTVILRGKSPSSLFHSSEPPLKSTTESLRQLSLQMSGLVNDAESQDPSGPELTILELERRNNELAAMLDNEKQTSMQHSQIIIELRNKISLQETQIEAFQNMNLSANNGTEVNGLREQLQVHIQTIGILVAEKSELQSNLSHMRHALEQKNGEVTDLQGRLDASRQRVREFESIVQELESKTSSLHDSKESNTQQLLNLQSSFTKSSKMCDELKASVAELTERLAVKSEENQKLNNELSSTRRELELAQVHLQQLRGNSGDDLRKQIEQLQIAYTDAQSQIHNSRTAFDLVRKEKLQIEFEYRSYASQLASEMEAVKEKLNAEISKCNDIELIRKNLEEKLISEESKQSIKTSLEKVIKEKEGLASNFNMLTEEKKQLDEKCARLINDNGQLSYLLSEQSARLETLEAAADRKDTQQVDTTQLLQAMQSDKIAAARALTQNKQLKEQLEELQNGFVMMSNKKLELTEKLEKELHIKKNLHKEISQLGELVTSQKEELLKKQREIEEMGNNKYVNYHILPEKKVNQKILSNRIGIENSTEENILRDEVTNLKLAESEVITHSHLNGTDGSGDNIDYAEAAQEIVVQNKNSLNQDVPIHLTSLQSDSEVAFRTVHEALEKKFFKCMKDLAAVSDEKQNLEHLVQQLQLETDTVGDYITIYQFQRGVMKQQMQDLKSELDMLKTEKEEMVSKLNKLQKLFNSLAADKHSPQDSFLSGIKQIIDSNDIQKDEEESRLKENKNTNVSGSAESGSTGKESPHKTKLELESKTSKSATVKQIIDLISEMETSSQLDLTALHKFHPCPHCSGKLLTI